MFLPDKLLDQKIRGFLDDDLGLGDITTLITVPKGIVVQGEVIAKEAGVVAGLDEASALLRGFSFESEALVSEGSEVEEDTGIMRIIGEARTLLAIERSLLNLLARMCGIATKTRRIIKEVGEAGYGTRIASTRKVAPGLLYLDKKAVMIGGGDTHRLHLDDLVLIKDNHLAIIEDVREAVKRTQQAVSFSKKIEVEVSSEEEAIEAVEAGADIVMLDNFSPQRIRSTISLLQKKGLRDQVLIEASGGITEENVVKYAATGTDIISLGELTDSVRALDLSLEVTKATRK